MSDFVRVAAAFVLGSMVFVGILKLIGDVTVDEGPLLLLFVLSLYFICFIGAMFVVVRAFEKAASMLSSGFQRAAHSTKAPTQRSTPRARNARSVPNVFAATDVGHMLRYGPGSPGETAEAFAKLYLYVCKGNEDEEWKSVFSRIGYMRLQAWTSNNLLMFPISQSTEAILAFTFLLPTRSMGDLPTFVFYLMYFETEQFRDNIFASEGVFKLSTEVMYDTVRSIAPHSIRKTLDEFRSAVRSFPRSPECVALLSRIQQHTYSL